MLDTQPESCHKQERSLSPLFRLVFPKDSCAVSLCVRGSVSLRTLLFRQTDPFSVFKPVWERMELLKDGAL